MDINVICTPSKSRIYVSNKSMEGKNGKEQILYWRKDNDKKSESTIEFIPFDDLGEHCIFLVASGKGLNSEIRLESEVNIPDSAFYFQHKSTNNVSDVVIKLSQSLWIFQPARVHFRLINIPPTTVFTQIMLVVRSIDG